MADRSLARGMGALLVLVGGALMGVEALTLADDLEASGWTRTPALVGRIEAVRDPSRGSKKDWRVLVTYRYRIPGGAELEGTQLEPGDRWFSAVTAEATAAELRAAPEHHCHVDPHNPRRAVLRHALEGGVAPYVALPLTPLLLGLALLLWGRRQAPRTH